MRYKIAFELPFIHQKNINDEWFDEQIWVYAKKKNKLCQQKH